MLDLTFKIRLGNKILCKLVCVQKSTIAITIGKKRAIGRKIRFLT